MGDGIGEDVADGDVRAAIADVVELVPVARELMAIGDRRQVQRVGQFDVVAKFGQFVVGVDVVQLRGGIAAVRARAEVGVGESEVGFLAGLFGLAQLEFE